ncbi:hypothetical protein ACFL4J_01110 [Candidatus Margulisiibacteriota bacterium]
MSEVSVLSGVVNAFKEFLFGAGPAAGVTSCNNPNQPAANAASPNVTLSQAEIADAWEKTSLDKCSDPNLNNAKVGDNPAFWDNVAGKIFEQAAYSKDYTALSPDQRVEAKKLLVEALTVQYDHKTLSDLYNSSEWASHDAKCMASFYGNYFPQTVYLALTSENVRQALAKAKATPVGAVCSGGGLTVVRDDLTIATGRAGEPITIKPMYAAGAGLDPLPADCKYVIGSDNVAVRMEKASGPATFPVRIVSAGSFKLAQGTHQVGLECAGTSVPVGEIKIGPAAAKVVVKPDPAPVKPEPKPQPKPEPKPDKPAPAAKKGPCDGLSGVFLSACKKKNNIQ